MTPKGSVPVKLVEIDQVILLEKKKYEMFTKTMTITTDNKQILSEKLTRAFGSGALKIV